MVVVAVFSMLGMFGLGLVIVIVMDSGFELGLVKLLNRKFPTLKSWSQCFEFGRPSSVAQLGCMFVGLVFGKLLGEAVPLAISSLMPDVFDDWFPEERGFAYSVLGGGILCFSAVLFSRRAERHTAHFRPGTPVRYGGYSGCTVRSAEANGTAVIHVPGVGDETAGPGAWSVESSPAEERVPTWPTWRHMRGLVAPLAIPVIGVHLLAEPLYQLSLPLGISPLVPALLESCVPVERRLFCTVLTAALAIVTLVPRELSHWAWPLARCVLFWLYALPAMLQSGWLMLASTFSAWFSAAYESYPEDHEGALMWLSWLCSSLLHASGWCAIVTLFTIILLVITSFYKGALKRGQGSFAFAN